MADDICPVDGCETVVRLLTGVQIANHGYGGKQPSRELATCTNNHKLTRTEGSEWREDDWVRSA